MTKVSDGRRRAVLAVVAMTTAAIWLVGGPVASADPSGNNGTVKVGGEELSGNDPHVGCAFTVDFFGYDEGDLDADVVLDAHAPTAGGTIATTTVFIGEDPAGGANDLDASAPFDLTGVFTDPPDAQGYHVRLTVHADGSQGADVKHKTFWVDCAPGEGGGEEGGAS